MDSSHRQIEFKPKKNGIRMSNDANDMGKDVINWRLMVSVFTNRVSTRRTRSHDVNAFLVGPKAWL